MKSRVPYQNAFFVVSGSGEIGEHFTLMKNTCSMGLIDFWLEVEGAKTHNY